MKADMCKKKTFHETWRGMGLSEDIKAENDFSFLIYEFGI